LKELGTAVLLGDFESGSDEWHKLRGEGLGGSEIGTVLGLNPYESAYTLMHKKCGLIPSELTPNWSIRFGRAFEAPILELFKEEHPELDIQTTGTWAHKDHNWMHANPDALYFAENGEIGIVEIKTARAPWDEVPAAYVAQVMWYMHVFGVKKAYIVAVAGWNWEEHVIEYDEFYAEVMIASATRFMEYVRTQTKPDWDGSESTYQTARMANRGVEESSADIGNLSIQLQVAQANYDTAKNELTKLKSQVLDLMGESRHAVDGKTGRVVASKQQRKDGIPYLVMKGNK
jgi:putative phage-type endonuclease